MTDFFSMPMSAGPRDTPVGMDELGNPVYMTTLGGRYAETQKPGFDGSYVKAAVNAVRKDPFGAIGNAISGAAQGAWDAFSAPGRAASGAGVTMGDAFGTAGMVSLPALAGKYDPAVANMGIRAYHGSPHDFDRFSMDKIGTGEGAQAYGHGLYFADSEGVARSYRDALADRNFGDLERLGNVLYAALDPLSDGDVLFKGGKYSKEQIVDMTKRLHDDDPPFAWGTLAPSLRDKVEEGLKGHMYEVDINADPADFLDWDAPLSEQPNILAKIDAENVKYDDLVGAAARVNIDDLEKLKGLTGAQYYNAVGGGPSSKARELNRGQRSFPRKDGTWNTDPLGIPGIKYRDAGSRGIDGAEGVSRNYVVFDDSLIDIVRKYGIAGALPLGALGLEQETRAYLDRLPKG